MHQAQAQVRAWHQAMGDQFPDPGTSPIDLTRNTRLRLDLILEELRELGLALGHRLDADPADTLNIDWWDDPTLTELDPVETADALADLLFVIYGAADTWGINMDPVFAEILRSNYTKVGGPVREDGKRLKPPTYEPPDLEGALQRSGHTW